jgi:hypothetical protein
MRYPTLRFNFHQGSNKTVRKTHKRLSITTLLSTSTIQEAVEVGVETTQTFLILEIVLLKGNHHSQVKELKE